jgi:uncharacterized caspase-like protein
MDTRITDLAKEKGLGAGGSQGARGATGELPVPAPGTPDPEVVGVARRRHTQAELLRTLYSELVALRRAVRAP